jgi:hypothetical protein
LFYVSPWKSGCFPAFLLLFIPVIMVFAITVPKKNRQEVAEKWQKKALPVSRQGASHGR